MEFCEDVPANTQTYALVISNRMLKFILNGTDDRDEAHRGGEVVLVRGKATDSSTIVVSVGSVSVQPVFTPSLYLKNRGDYELAMVNLETYYSFANIRADNNSLK